MEIHPDSWLYFSFHSQIVEILQLFVQTGEHITQVWVLT